MAKDTKTNTNTPLSGGAIPAMPVRTGANMSEFDKFTASNLDKAIIGTPTADGGINPISSGSNGNPQPNPNVLELPSGITSQQAIQLQSAFKAIMAGQSLAPTNPNPMGNPPPQVRDVIVPDTQTRMWNPMQPFVPTAKLSDMEASVNPGYVNPNAVIVNAPINTKLNPKEDCPIVLIDCYVLIKALLDGRWLVPGCPKKQDCESMLLRLKSEIEEK